MKTALALGGVAALTFATLAGPAVADPALTSQQLTDVVPRAKDVKVFYRNAKSEQAPIAGTGVDYIGSQGICVKANGKFASLNKLSKRQAWSTQRIGEGEGRGVISIVGQYKSAKKAKNKLARVKELLGTCPAMVTDGDRDISQEWWRLAKMYKGKAVATSMVVEDADEPDFVQYVAIRQTGALLSFVRYSQQFEGATPNPTQYQGMVEYLSGKVAERYKALL